MHIVAMSSGTLGRTRSCTLLNEYALDFAKAVRPKICFLPTAVGDASESVVDFYATFDAGRYEPSHLTLFNRTVEDLRSFVLSQDAIYVSGGNTANMLAIWRVHGLDTILHEAWTRGTVLFGSSAGGLCWFECGITDSFGPGLAGLDNCLGFLKGSFCPHYDSEERRRPTYRRLVSEGLGAGWACDDGAALHFEGTQLVESITTSSTAMVYRVDTADGETRETPMQPRLLL
ncbi:MAG: Type 1 glutamine amidotransferase-like domain-containing protein [Chloroflexota bacterium]